MKLAKYQNVFYFATSVAIYMTYHTFQLSRHFVSKKTAKKKLNKKAIIQIIEIIEQLIQKDEGKRGIGPIIQPAGELLGACQAIHQAKSVAIITGFPCLLQHTPPTETDGPLGALAIAKALLALGKEVTVLTDECNEEVLLACSAATWIDHHGLFSLQSFPPEQDFDEMDWGRLQRVAEGVDLVVAIERAGRNKDSKYLTMRCKDMTSIVAPLDYLIGMERDEKEGKMVSIGIGDGGNEVGMGKAYQAIVSSAIPNASEIACIVPADHLLVSSVSNWGGYGLAAASLLYSRYLARAVEAGGESGRESGGEEEGVEEEYLSNQLAMYLPTAEEERGKCQRIVEAGARDGITGERALRVDGMDLQVSLDLIDRLRKILK